MLELGLPARLSDESLKTVDYWCQEFKENPCMMDALESDVNNALDVIRKAERGEKIKYATLRNGRQTTTMQEQMPKHYFVATKSPTPGQGGESIVLVIDREAEIGGCHFAGWGFDRSEQRDSHSMNKGAYRTCLE